MVDSIRLITFGPLPIRIILGSLFIIAGWPKLAELQQTQSFFTIMGLPQELALLISLLEVIGGILLIAGLLTRITALILTIEMIGVIIISSISDAIVLPQGFEIALLSIPFIYLALCIALTLTGPGKLSIEWNVLKREIMPKGKELIHSLIAKHE